MGSKILLGCIWISGNIYVLQHKATLEIMILETDIENDKEYMILTATSNRIWQLCDAPKT